MLFYSCFVAILSAAVALIVEKDLSSWSLKSTSTLIPIIYSVISSTQISELYVVMTKYKKACFNFCIFFMSRKALFGNVFQVSIIMWCVRKRGPLFASVFHPLGVIFATAMGVIILGEALYLGRYISYSNKSLDF